VAAVINPDSVDSNGGQKLGPFEIREGDWKAYLYHSKKCHEQTDIIDRYGSVTAYKRACALAYLGRRAQYRGGVCNIRHPHIMTPQFIANLAASNKTQRYTRYPWLETFMNMLEEIERVQDQISISKNVISFMPTPVSQ
jgi:hypothetical protein